MGKLHLPKYLGYDEIGESVVDILTLDKKRSSVWTTQLKGLKFHKILGINSVSEEGPVKLWGYDERGLVNPMDPEKIYLIDKSNKIIYFGKRNFNLFYDQDKAIFNKYIWEGSFEEVLDEFRDKGYNFIEEIK